MIELRYIQCHVKILVSNHRISYNEFIFDYLHNDSRESVQFDLYTICSTSNSAWFSNKLSSYDIRTRMYVFIPINIIELIVSTWYVHFVIKYLVFFSLGLYISKTQLQRVQATLRSTHQPIPLRMRCLWASI